MSVLDSSHGLSRTLFSMFHSAGATFSHNGQLRPDMLVYGIKNKFLSGFDRIQHALSRHIPRASVGAATLELLDLESQHDKYQQVTNNVHGPDATPFPPLRNVNNRFTAESDDSATASGRPAAYREHDSHSEPPMRPKRTQVWLAMFVSTVLSVIVVPGLVVGVMTRQMSWGVELSGAIAPIISLLAGLYYHKKR